VEGIFRTPRNPPAYLKRITALESRSIERTVGEGEDSTAVPKAVQEVYNRMLALIRESRRDDVISALAWLVELGGSADADLIRRAAYIEPDMTAPDEDLQDSAEGLVDASFGFVTLEDSSQGQQQFRLAHETCRDYFRSYADTSKWPTMLAQTSLTYLSFERSMSLWTGPPGLPWRTAEDSLFDAACEFLLSDMEGVDGSQTRNALERLLYSSGPNLGDFIFMVAQVIQRRRCNERQDLMQELLINLEVAVEPGNVLFFSLELLIASCIGLTSDVRSVVRGSISHLGWNMALMLCAFFGRESFAIELFKIWPYISPGPVIDYSRTVLHFTALAPPDSYLRIKATKLLIDHGIQMPHGAPGGGTLLHLISPDVPFAGLLNGCGTPYGTVVDKQHTVVHKKPHEDMQSVARLVIERGPLLENALELERETLPRWIHFNQIGDMELLGEALYLDREALRLRPEGHPERALSCENLAVLLRTRFNQTGDTWLMDKVLELQREALALHPVGHPERALSCGNLAISLRTLFNQDGDTLLLDEALELQREALTLQPVGHPERAVSCGNLASSLKTCFDHAGDTALLDKALELEREALALQPEGHPEHGLSCGNLASSLWTRFNHTRDTSLLDETFGLDREALRLHPQGHPERAVSCENLAVSLWTRFNQTGDPTLLDEILELQREALALRPAGHPDRAESCTNLANSLRTRFEQTGDTALLDDALELDREVLRRDPARALLCANLVISLEARFNQTGEVRFLNEAESLCSRAIKDHALSPSDHVLLRVQLVRIYTSPAYPSSSLSTAVRFLSEAVVHRIGLITHFYAVNVALLLCVRAAVSDEENVRLLAVYEVIIEVLPEIGGASLDKVWRLCGRCDEADIPTQALIQAVKANDVPSGLILWEQGRAVRWSHILAMRDPQYEGLTHEWKTRLQTLLKSTSFLAEHGKTQQLSLTTCDREPEFYSRLQLLLEEIRASPGLLRFMRGLSYSELAQVSSMHPVIVLFTDGKACHTLVLSSASDSPAHLVLPHIPPFVLSVVGHDIRNPAAAPDPVRSVRPFGRRFEDRFRGALGRLWACTVKPLLDHLGLQVRELTFTCL
jgi:tetratricopeptide (TPR) repeat protein